uniref:Plastid lipid-associated protein/fibrillin conserved domain-containing protein n=1 Tax=Odontella aurita TaxID=265563 RepID=A0A7S4HLH9_9STRA|mmetsp:Transcript_11896/g.34859  ORF Transcript_11896/g.34859 Transcript_11896/m.34859 type:complete len:110 (+) Transcript_11896:137-466(+)
MSNFRTVAFLAFLACSTFKAGAFSPLPPARPSPVLRMCPGGKDEGSDPTKVWYAEIADGIQNLLTNSPLNEGKKALVRSLAGDYDKQTIRAKLNGLIEDNSVLMLSFVK